MNNGNLPRIEVNASNKNLLAGGLYISGGLFVALLSLGAWVASFVLERFEVSGYPLRFTQWLMLIVAVGLLCIGANRISVNSTFKKLRDNLNSDNQIEELSSLAGVSVTKMLYDISLLNYRKYWRSIEITDKAVAIYTFGDGKGSDNAILGNSNVRLLPAKGMQFGSKITHVSVPLPLVMSVLLAIAVLLPVSGWLRLLVVIAAFILSIPCKKIFSLMMPKTTFITYNESPAFVPEKIELMLSNSPEANELIGVIEGHLSQLSDLSFKITDGKLKSDIDNIAKALNQMAGVLRNNPEKYRLVRETLDYSVPTAIKIYYNYIELDKQPVKGDNIKKAMAKVHDMSSLVVSTLDKEVDGLYKDRSLDIEVDLEVMRNVLQQEVGDIFPLVNGTNDIK